MKNISIPALAILLSAHIASVGQEARTAWVGTWAAAPIGTAVNAGQLGPANATYRNIVHISIGGSGVRVQFTNEFGTTPLKMYSPVLLVSACCADPFKELRRVTSACDIAEP